MNKVTFFTVEGVENVLIDKGNGEFSGMTKAEYDRRQEEQVEHLTEIVPADE